MRNYAKNKEFEQLKLLKKEAKGLMQLIGIVSIVEIQETRKKFNDHRKDVINGAGLVSDKTVKYIYDNQQRMNRIDKREPDRRGYNVSSSMFDPYHVNPSHSMPMMPKGILLEDQLRQKKAKDSMNVGLSSFNMSREMAALKYRPSPEELYDRSGRARNPVGSMVRHSSNGSMRNDAFLDYVNQVPQSYRQFTKGNYIYPGQRYPSPHILRDNGRNIMKTVDNEYQNIVWNHMNTDKRQPKNIDKRFY